MARSSKKISSKSSRAHGGVGPRLGRREVLKAGGVLGAAAFLEGCGGRERQQIEQVLDRSRTPPGTARWVRSICGQCAGMCELSVRVIDGRAKKIEGDPTSRVSMGGVCALGHSALQGLYLPERPTFPMRLVGGERVETTWEEALQEIAPRLGGAGDLALCCGPDPLERAAIETIAVRMGASVTVVEPPVRAIERVAAERWLGEPADVEFSFDDTKLLITLGTAPLDSSRNSVSFARRVAEARAHGMRWIHVGERMSLSAAKADLWIAPHPGSAHHLVGLLNVLALDDPAQRAPEAEAEGVVSDHERDVDAAAAALDVPRNRLQRLVRWWHEASDAVVMVGAEELGGAGSEDSEERRIEEMVDRYRLARCVDTSAKGSAGMRAFAGLARQRQSLGRAEVGELRERSLSELAAALQDGEVETVVAIGVDPVAAMPANWGMQDLGSERVVSIADRLDETARVADWVLPAQTDLEQIQMACSPSTAELLLADGVVGPRGEARHPLDVARALAIAAGVEQSTLPFEDVEDLRARIVESVADLGGSTAARAIRGALRADGRLALQMDESWRVDLPEPSEPTSAILREPESVAPSATDATLALQLFEAPRGELEAFDRPWIGELPDPVSTVMWGSWIEISPVDAERFGLSQGEAVDVAAAGDPSRVVASTAYIHPACRPGTAAMPLGAFRRGEERSCALDLLSAAPANGAPSLRVAVELRPGTSTPAPIFGRGLRSAEHIPAGWKAHEHASLESPSVPGGGPSKAPRPQVIELGSLARRSEGEPA